MISEKIYELISTPENLNRETLYELRNLVAHYPYFQTARLLYLKNLYLLHDISFGEELRKAALYITDRRVLFYLIEGDKFKLSPKQKQVVEELLADNDNIDRTLSLIDAFLSTMPDESGQPSRLDISLDYTSFLLEKEDVPVETDTDNALWMK